MKHWQLDLQKLSGDWCALFSGGKDSTTVVTLIEYLRRTGQINAPRPQLVQSDTMVEEPHLQAIARDMVAVLESSGWECAMVEPEINQKLYNRILGIGNSPVHAGGGRFMRWCTRATKIDPMNRWRKEHSSGLVLTGLRLGESRDRDTKIKKAGGCVAGGECGIPAASANTYSPILNWSTCMVIDWLSGHMPKKQREVMRDFLPIMRRLVDIYEVSIGQDGLWEDSGREISAARFGCIGCPAISSERMAPRLTVKRNKGRLAALNEIYDVWFEARLRDNRLVNLKTGGRGPIKMAVRKVLFARIMDIQRRAGVVLITPEDEEFIRQCWRDKVYPRGWSEADEFNLAEDTAPLLHGNI